VHRVQSVEVTRAVIDAARASRFRSINVDLIYGLPKQTAASFGRTLDRVIELEPDRIALYSYAHLPQLFKPQRRIVPADLPSADEKLRILMLAIRRLGAAGYVYIGMDHFARPEDELAVAQREGRLQRDFQGYSTCPESDLIGLGISAIGRIGASYYQNHKRLEDYGAALDAGQLPVARGVALTREDQARRAVIQALACHFCVSIPAIESAHRLHFAAFFRDELADLRRLEDEGLVKVAPELIQVTPLGRLLVRAVCMVFDRYLREHAARATYSKVI
jgi:oxygen-independent coproporphyrinogen-3 oxidase